MLQAIGEGAWMDDEKLEWVSNDSRVYAGPMVTDWSDRAETRKADLAWRASLIKGRPKATSAYTVEQLEGFGMIGFYRAR